MNTRKKTVIIPKKGIIYDLLMNLDIFTFYKYNIKDVEWLYILGGGTAGNYLSVEYTSMVLLA